MLSSPNDHRQYRYITLNNALRVLLIKDANASISAGALSVNVGHFNDPKDREGLAHFLEHMLFLGTAKYPKVGEFQSFISQHGGSYNAWTGTENTTYFFDIQSCFFQQGLERFSQFFIAPLFNKEAVEKERQAVDSEYKLKIQDDVRRIYQVQKETINQAHPFSQFSVGNLITLADRKNKPVRDDLIRFYQQHYSANLMTLALSAPFSLDTLEEIATSCFSGIKNLSLKANTLKVPFITEKQCKKYIYIEPLKDIKKLTLSFSIPQSQATYKTKSLSFISDLLGDESQGSLFSVLKNKGFISQLSAGGGLSGSNFREFSISLSLTKAGLDAQDAIISTVFQAIRLIRQSGLNEWRYLEKKHIQAQRFHYQAVQSPLKTVSHLVVNMHHYDEADILIGDYIMQRFDVNEIKQILDCLTPEKVRVTLVAKGQVDNEKTPYSKKAKWYNTPYRIKTITKASIKGWQQSPISNLLALSKKNPFIAQKLTLRRLTKPLNLKPALLSKEESGDLWFLQESQFRIPKGLIFIAIDSLQGVNSVKNNVKLRVCIEMLKEKVNETTYQALIAGLNFNLYTTQNGAGLVLSGFTEKLPLLLELLLEAFKNRTFDSKQFSIIKHQLLRAWNNTKHNKPVNQLHHLLSSILQPHVPSYEALIKALEPLEVTELADFVLDFLSQIHINLFVYGNWQEKEAKALKEKVKKALYIKDQTYKKVTRPLLLLEGAKSVAYHHDCNHEDSAVVVYYQSKDISAEKSALYGLAQQLMSSTFFHQLRTKQQLGYMVGTNNMALNRRPGLLFYVQSPKVGPNILLDAIDDFLNAFFMVLLSLTKAEWQASKQGLITKLEEPETNLNARGQYFWSSIIYQEHNFNQKQEVINAITHLSRARMIKFVIERLKPRTADRLIMHSCGKAHLGQELPTDTLEITDIPLFRRHKLKNE